MSIVTAQLDWQTIDGIDIPFSKQFGDVYFSRDNGILETQHVFLNGNNLTQRLSTLNQHDYFCVAETGFGSGLNFLALWQLWQQVRPHPSCRLHMISVEKYPLSHADLQRALNAWPELAQLSQQLLAAYPQPLAGCHRLNFAADGLSLDLWLGDANTVLPQLNKQHGVDAWFLDGFSPSCNPDLWQSDMIEQVVRLSKPGTTFSSFSVAGVLKQALRKHGAVVTRPRGYKHKRQMLKAWLPHASMTETATVHAPQHSQPNHQLVYSSPLNLTPQRIAVVGAGIAGLNSAWALAQRGHQVFLFDATAPLAGASGNPQALLNPKLSAAAKSADHLMTLAWQQALRFYAGFQGYRALTVDKLVFKANDQSLNLAAEYPAAVLTAHDAEHSTLSTEFPCVKLHQAACLAPHQFAAQVLAHPNIQFQQCQIDGYEELEQGLILFGKTKSLQNDGSDEAIFATNSNATSSTTSNTTLTTTLTTTSGTALPLHVDRMVVCCARANADLLPDYPQLRPIRGQISWCNTEHGLAHGQAYSYGGYALAQDAQTLLLGASFLPGRDDTDVLAEDHAHNFGLIQQFFPELASHLPPIQQWQGRASVRAQTRDYLPIVGAYAQSQRVFSMAGMGSKGFLFAPLCSEVLCALMWQETLPVSQHLLQQLLPTRFDKTSKVTKAKKPYFKDHKNTP